MYSISATLIGWEAEDCYCLLTLLTLLSIDSIYNPSFIIASVLVPGRFALIFWMSWIIWRNKVSLPSTFYELPV